MTEPKQDTPNSLTLTRRRLLGTTLAGAAALLAQACGRATPPPPPTGTAALTATPSGTVPPGSPTAPPVSVAPVTGTAATTGTPGGSTINLPIIGGSGGTATAAPTATPSATATEVPTLTPSVSPSGPTSTPFPTTTPIPLATPFPPGPATKLGIFLGYQHPALEALLRTGNLPLVKTLEYDANLVEFIKQVSPSTLVVARYSLLGQLDAARVDPIAEAHRFVQELLPIATDPKRLAYIDAWEAYNEPVVKTRDEMQRLAAFEAERTRLLAAAGIRSCVGNFATGTPPLELWPDFFPALQAVKETGGYLGLHEYSAPYMWWGTARFQAIEGQNEGDEGWLTLRYRKVYRQFLIPNDLVVPLVFTETGIDGGILERPGPRGFGWQDFGEFWKGEGQARTTAAGFYLEQLAWYDAELQQDEYVKGSAIFALAAPVGWTSFEILGEVSEGLQQYITVHPRR